MMSLLHVPSYLDLRFLDMAHSIRSSGILQAKMQLELFEYSSNMTYSWLGMSWLGAGFGRLDYFHINVSNSIIMCFPRNETHHIHCDSIQLLHKVKTASSES